MVREVVGDVGCDRRFRVTDGVLVAVLHFLEKLLDFVGCDHFLEKLLDFVGCDRRFRVTDGVLVAVLHFLEKLLDVHDDLAGLYRVGKELENLAVHFKRVDCHNGSLLLLS